MYFIAHYMPKGAENTSDALRFMLLEQVELTNTSQHEPWYALLQDVRSLPDPARSKQDGILPWCKRRLQSQSS